MYKFINELISVSGFFSIPLIYIRKTLLENEPDSCVRVLKNVSEVVDNNRQVCFSFSCCVILETKMHIHHESLGIFMVDITSLFFNSESGIASIKCYYVSAHYCRLKKIYLPLLD